MKLKIKETYLLLIIVMGLVSLSVYSTYALFTASTTIDDVVSFNATLNTDNNLIEYEMITLSPGEVKMVEINVNNTYSTSLYYGTWYQIVSPSDTTDIVVGLTDDNTSSGSGALAKTSSIKLIVGLANNSSKTAIINIGTVGSTTSNLNLPTGRDLIPEGFSTTNADLIIDSFKVNGTEATTFPINTGSYNIDTTCSNANITYNPKTLRYEVSNISKNKNAKCGFTYTTKSNITYLNNYIISLAGTTQGTGKVVNETATLNNILDSSNYLNVGNDATYPFAWNDTNKTWTSTNKTNSASADIGFKLSSNGDYKICYTQSSESNYDYATIYKNGVSQKSLKGVSTSTFTCYSLGTLSTNDLITVDYQKDSSGSSGNDEVVFYMQKTSNSNSYRYEGKNPNNYIYFNNELWRIIGVFDDASHGIYNTNLVKIIRNDSLGTLIWDKSGVNDWANSSAYHLLNEYYFPSINGIDSDYCYRYIKNDTVFVKSNCNYLNKGIHQEYRDMVKEVTWYLGGTPSGSTSSTASNFYVSERSSTNTYTGNTFSVIGNIGLMYVSDYGYSVLSSDCSRNTEVTAYYSSTNCPLNSWLKTAASEWTITHTSGSSKYVYYINNYDSGYIINSEPKSAKVLRPVLYLKSSTQHISGDGSSSDPYIIN